MSEEYGNDQAIISLSAENLEKTISDLLYYIQNSNDKASLFEVINGMVDLSDNIGKLETYTADQVQPLQRLLKIMSLTIPSIQDSALRGLLEDIKPKLEEFLKTIGETPEDQTGKYPMYPKYDYGYPTKESPYKKLADNILHSRDGRADVLQDIALSLNQVHSNPSVVKGEVNKFDKMVTEGIERYYERKNERDALARSFMPASSRKTELSADPIKDPKGYVRRNLAQDAAGQLLRSEKAKQ
jgi:hypothetical protein